VRSSTSSSSDRIPPGNWGGSWVAALLLVALSLGGWESFWRARGFRPSLNDDAALWALSRKEASNGDPDSVVFVGASRIQLGLNTEVFAEKTGKRPIVLAIDGESPIPVLRNLASDESFRGLVISELTERDLLFSPAMENETNAKGTAAEWLRAYKANLFS
jgi:hypothetical protein